MYEIVKETEKAVAVEAYAGQRMSYNAKMDDVEYTDMTKLVWLPKSKVTIENGKVVDMPKWLAFQTGLKTAEQYAKHMAIAWKNFEKNMQARRNGNEL